MLNSRNVRRAVVLGLWVLSAPALTTACKREIPGNEPASTSESTSERAKTQTQAPSPATGASFTLDIAGGPKLQIQRENGRLKVQAGTQEWGVIKLEPDRVKVEHEGAEVAKAKAKSDGFKVYDGSREVFKLKRRGSGFSVRNADDHELGRLEADSGNFGSESVTIESLEGDRRRLKRGNAALVTVQGALSPRALLVLAVPDTTLAQRLAMLTMLSEGIVR